MSNHNVKHIAICGSGLAALLCAAALIKTLPPDINLSLLDIPGSDETDIFYGDVTSPSTYEFLLKIGIIEPELLPNTNTAFSLGTRYNNWGQKKRSWMQSFHHPLPTFHGVEFHHYLSRVRGFSAETAELESYIMSAHAANKGVFVHPPEDKKSPLFTMDYGYHFSAKDWRKFLLSHIENSPTSILNGDLQNLDRVNGKIISITLTGNQKLEADFYIDCTGSNSKINQSTIKRERQLRAVSSLIAQSETRGVCRELEGAGYGWISKSALQDGLHKLTVYEPTSEKIALNAHGQPDNPPVQTTIGYSNQPWQGNCLALGHSAAVLEPLTPAPLMLLQRDIERLMELIPYNEDMHVEEREYNRKFTEDYEHSSIFQRAFFENNSQEKDPYWQAALANTKSLKLDTKITQFQSRGNVVQYDFEPFCKEDWIQQHYGMGRLPRRYDPLANRAVQQQLVETLLQMRAANETLASKLPPHHIYMKKLLEYFRKKNDG